MSSLSRQLIVPVVDTVSMTASSKYHQDTICYETGIGQNYNEEMFAKRTETLQNLST